MCEEGGNRLFGKLFRTPNAWYYFDANRNEMVEVEEETFCYLQHELSGKETGMKPEELICAEANGYFSRVSNVKHVKHPLEDYLENYLDRRLLKLTLQVTQNCNFRCRYCVYSEEHNNRQRMHSEKSMNWETAKQAVDFLWKHSLDSSHVNIGFYGGEPLLEMSLIRQVIIYSEKLFAGKELSFNITTNGTLLNEEIVSFLKEHNVALMISLDGSKEINDRNRVFPNGEGTYDTVVKKIEMVRRIAPEYARKMQISMVMDPQNDFDCINEIYIEEKDFNKLFVSAALVDREYDGERTLTSEAYAWKYRYQRFLAMLSYFGRVSKERVSPIVSVAVSADIGYRHEIDNYPGLFETDAPGGPCIPGQLRLFCNVDGKLFPCERVSEKSEMCCIGSLEDGFDIEKAKVFLNVGQVTEEDCRNCWSFRYCSLCGKKADAGSGRPDAKTKKMFCAEACSRAEDKMKLYLLFKEIPVYYAAQTAVPQEEEA